MERLTVNASRSYDIIIGAGLLDNAGEYIAAVHKPCKAVIVAGTNVAPLYADRVLASMKSAGFDARLYVIPAGEQHKKLSVVEELLLFCAEAKLTRSDIMVALGGGVTGDMTGFAAAIYRRGIEFIQLPTTLLAAVDSSVGGKTAVDLPIGKNLVGAFHQPSLVLCDTDTLDTLPEEIFRAGCAEVIKYGILGNEPFFNELRSKHIADQIEHVIAVCAAMKRDIVNEDEFELGVRKLLNLGHSFGHAVETYSDYSLSHGFSVSIGMAIITRAAYAKGCCSRETLVRVLDILSAYDLPTECDYTSDELLDIALSDKKFSAGSISLIVPTGIGSCVIEKVPGTELKDWLIAGGLK